MPKTSALGTPDVLETRIMLWNTETWAWEASTKGSGVGEAVSVENFPAVMSGTSIPVSGEIISKPETLTTRIDEASATLTYVGEAPVGKAEDTNEWRIKLLDESTNPLSVKWADGNANFDNKWSDRTQKSYS